MKDDKFINVKDILVQFTKMHSKKLTIKNNSVD